MIRITSPGTLLIRAKIIHRNEPLGAGAIFAIFGIGLCQHLFLVMAADPQQRHHRQRDCPGPGRLKLHRRADDGDDLHRIERMADPGIGPARHQLARLRHDRETLAQLRQHQQRAQAPQPDQHAPRTSASAG